MRSVENRSCADPTPLPNRLAAQYAHIQIVWLEEEEAKWAEDETAAQDGAALMMIGTHLRPHAIDVRSSHSDQVRARMVPQAARL